MNADRQQTIWNGVIVGVIGSATVALIKRLVKSRVAEPRKR